MIGRGIAASRGKALARAMAAETQQQIDLEKKSKENLLHSVERVKEAIDSIAEEMKDEETRLEVRKTFSPEELKTTITSTFPTPSTDFKSWLIRSSSSFS